MGIREHHLYDLQAEGLLAGEIWEIKPPAQGKLSLVLIFPNAYHFGMANLGYLTVHRLAATVPGIGVERFFPILSGRHPLTPPFYSLETRRPLGDFAILVFSFSFEGDFDVLPPLLGALGIPILASERGRAHPLLIAGGAAIAANGLALSRIFDVLVPGEAETTWPLMLQRFLESGASPSAVADLPGVWTPGSVPQPNPPPAPHDVAAAPAFSHVLTPHQVFQGAQLLEVMRGCPRMCAFCLARAIYAPARPVPLSRVEEWLAARPDKREIGLVAPSLFDHPELVDMLRLLATQGRRLFNSSVKWERLSTEVLQLLRRCGVGSLTLAPETGSHRLQTLMGKGLREDAFFATLSSVVAEGFEQVKLYFLFGLPTETEEDLEATAAFIEGLAPLLGKGGLGVTAAFSSFIPKRGTRWEDQEFCGIKSVKKNIRWLRNRLGSIGPHLKLDFAGPQESARQAYLARVGPELAEEYQEEARACRHGFKSRAGEFDHGSF